MKAKELMIGDWVYNQFTRKTLRLTFGRDLDLVEELCLEPIPLTEEILEKNGFTCDANGMNDSDELVVSVEYGEYQRNTDDGFKMLADGKAIEYVHELQHALRLCGVEKEIEL